MSRIQSFNLVSKWQTKQCVYVLRSDRGLFERRTLCKCSSLFPSKTVGEAIEQSTRFTRNHFSATNAMTSERHVNIGLITQMVNQNGSYFVRAFSTSPSEPPKVEKREATGNEPKVTSRAEKIAKLKLTIRDYGGTVVVFHVAISITSLAICYLLVKAGFPVQQIIDRIHVSENMKNFAVGGSTFIVSYVLHKAFAPARIACTLCCAPPLVTYLRRKGILTPSKVNIPKVKVPKP